LSKIDRSDKSRRDTTTFFDDAPAADSRSPHVGK
jgi:hypothetical protein